MNRSDRNSGRPEGRRNSGNDRGPRREFGERPSGARRPNDQGNRGFGPRSSSERRPAGGRSFRSNDSRPPSTEASDDAKYYVVGRRAALELLRDEENYSKIEKIYVAHGAQGTQINEILHHARANKLTLGELDKRKFRDLEERVAGDTDPQGVMILTAARAYQELEDVAVSIDGKAPLLIALDGIEDPHNMGAILRSAEAAGATAVLLPKRGAVLTPAVFKTSAGAAAHIPIVKYGNLAETISRLKEEFNVFVYGLAGEGEKTIYDVKFDQPVCLVTGSEEKGMHRLVRERCDEVVKIPLAGKTDSLNASVATAVAVFEAVRQRSLA
jgi:23S rRNA (guanosine2251-2'-O)-methyltransferase